MFIRLPAILLVKRIDSYLHEFCARGILNHNSNAWIKDEERMKTSLTEEKWKQFEKPVFVRFLSKMAARSWIITPPWPLVSLFLHFLSNLNFVLFYGCFLSDFVWKLYEIKL